MNTQPIEKSLTSDGESLDVVEVFNTIQGEGPFTGHRAIFVRLAGCNLQCPGCDTDYTSDRQQRTLDEIIAAVYDLAATPYLVVITGGEPFRQNITPLVNTLIRIGFHVQIETNGTLSPSAGLSCDATIVCSPKTGKLNTEIAKRANCFKYVLSWDSMDTDGLPIKALDHSVKTRVARPPASSMRPVYLQPMDCKDDVINARNLAVVTASCMRHGYILQIQIHKLIGVD